MFFLFVQLCSVGTDTFALANSNAADFHKPELWNIDRSINFWDEMWPPADTKWQKYLATLNKINFSYSVSMTLFPIFSNLKNKTNQQMINVTAVANSYGTFLYVGTGLIGFLMFGRTVDVDSNIIINVGR